MISSLIAGLPLPNGTVIAPDAISAWVGGPNPSGVARGLADAAVAVDGVGATVGVAVGAAVGASVHKSNRSVTMAPWLTELSDKTKRHTKRVMVVKQA